MNYLARFNRPWVHFVLIGLLLFNLQAKLFPELKPAIGPLGEARIGTLRQQWFARVGRFPTEEQQAKLVSAELDKDMLFGRALELKLHLYDPVVNQRLLLNMRFLQLEEGKTEQELYEQALDMRLHLGDEIVKRRLIRVMEQLLLGANPPQPVTENEIAASFAARREELRRPPTYSIDHLYFSREREADIESVVQTINAQGLRHEQALSMSSPFLSGYRFVQKNPEQLARYFGAAFVLNLQQAAPVAGQWLGPIHSTYGMHYVWVSEVEEATDAELEDVRILLQRDVESSKRLAALEASIAALRDRYEMML
jgi:hypothetical protein